MTVAHALWSAKRFKNFPILFRKAVSLEPEIFRAVFLGIYIDWMLYIHRSVAYPPKSFSTYQPWYNPGTEAKSAGNSEKWEIADVFTFSQIFHCGWWPFVVYCFTTTHQQKFKLIKGRYGEQYAHSTSDQQTDNLSI